MTFQEIEPPRIVFANTNGLRDAVGRSFASVLTHLDVRNLEYIQREYGTNFVGIMDFYAEENPEQVFSLYFKRGKLFSIWSASDETSEQ